MTFPEPTAPTARDERLQLAQKTGRSDALARLKGHRGRTATLTPEELAALLKEEAPATVGRIGSAIDDTP